MENGFFMQMCREAQDEIASGKTGWREANTNTLLLACFGMLSNHLASKLVKPMWLFATSISAGVAGFLINLALGG